MRARALVALLTVALLAHCIAKADVPTSPTLPPAEVRTKDEQ